MFNQTESNARARARHLGYYQIKRNSRLFAKLRCKYRYSFRNVTCFSSCELTYCLSHIDHLLFLTRYRNKFFFPLYFRLLIIKYDRWISDSSIAIIPKFFSLSIRKTVRKYLVLGSVGGMLKRIFHPPEQLQSYSSLSALLSLLFGNDIKLHVCRTIFSSTFSVNLEEDFRDSDGHKQKLTWRKSLLILSLKNRRKRLQGEFDVIGNSYYNDIVTIDLLIEIYTICHCKQRSIIT